MRATGGQVLSGQQLYPISICVIRVINLSLFRYYLAYLSLNGKMAKTDIDSIRRIEATILEKV